MKMSTTTIFHFGHLFYYLSKQLVDLPFSQIGRIVRDYLTPIITTQENLFEPVSYLNRSSTTSQLAGLFPWRSAKIIGPNNYQLCHCTTDREEEWYTIASFEQEGGACMADDKKLRRSVCLEGIRFQLEACFYEGKRFAYDSYKQCELALQGYEYELNKDYRFALVKNSEEGCTVDFFKHL